MSELPNKQYNSVFSTLDPTITIKYPKDFFGHPQANAQSYINIAREDIIDAIKKTISQNSSGGPHQFLSILLKRCSKSVAHPLQLLCKASLKTGEISIDLKLVTRVARGTFPRTTVLNHYITFTKNTGKNISKKYPLIPRNASENEPQATWLPL